MFKKRLVSGVPIRVLVGKKGNFNMKEIWKFIPGFEHHYQISNLGRVKRLQYKQVDSHGTGRVRIYPEKNCSTVYF